MKNKEIILPQVPQAIKAHLETKKVFMEKFSDGTNIEQNILEYANFEIPERLRNKYKRKE